MPSAAEAEVWGRVERVNVGEASVMPLGSSSTKNVVVAPSARELQITPIFGAFVAQNTEIKSVLQMTTGFGLKTAAGPNRRI
jgi:hypothetical protein